MRFGPLEAISPDAAVQHIDAAAAQMEAGDAGLGGASGGHCGGQWRAGHGRALLCGPVALELDRAVHA